MKANPLVSIIIPVYNCEQYLEACVSSVIGQTYSNFEIITINDGSTDGSLDILNRYASIDHRIVLIDKPNEGPALARKRGLEVAKGKYIQFLDSDDTLLSKAIELLVEKAEKTNADIIAVPFFFCELTGITKRSANLSFSSLSGIAYFKEILSNRAYWSLWSNFQRRSLYEDIDLEIVPDIFFGEDAIWMTQLLLNNPRVFSIEQPLLNYNINPMSLSNDESLMKKRYQSFRQFQFWIEDYIEKKNLKKYFKKELALQHLQTTFASIRWRQLQDVDKDMKNAIRDLKQYPDLKKTLSRRERKVIAFYRISNLAGHCYLLNCIKKRRI